MGLHHEDNFVGPRTLRNNVMNTTHREKGSDSSSPLQSAGPWVWLAGLTILATWLRVIGINKGLWWDEIYFLVISVRHPLAEIITLFPGDTQHPLYSILARLSVVAFGEHAWSLRLPALVFGVASIPILYLLGVSVTTRIEALLSAALLAVSYHHVWFSQNARGYTALAFWAILSTFFLLRGIQSGRRGPYVAYAVAASLGVYTHLTMVFLVVSHLFICTRDRSGGLEEGLGLGEVEVPAAGIPHDRGIVSAALRTNRDAGPEFLSEPAVRHEGGFDATLGVLGDPPRFDTRPGDRGRTRGGCAGRHLRGLELFQTEPPCLRIIRTSRGAHRTWSRPCARNDVSPLLFFPHRLRGSDSRPGSDGYSRMDRSTLVSTLS